ncbi:DUF1868 domain-containing protein [Serratia marcescens]|nr:DUF1868 domain-containing protein [Serratia marcescens]MBH2865760.1 DUF1868 domain-containing protein [Serratia marcescens]MBW4239694.1 DUF1868 domain-containing protein [Enterobacter roggenkampii]
MNQKTVPAGIVGGKFSRNGIALPFPGNTVLCHINGTPLYRRLRQFYLLMKESPLNGELYTLLPTESYHITLFDGVCRKKYGTLYWPVSFYKGGTIDDCTEYCREKLISSGIISPEKSFTISGIKDSMNTIALTVEPEVWCAGNLRKFRDRLAEIMEIRRTNHDSYTFHITLAYFLRYPDEKEMQHIRNLLLSFTGNLSEQEKSLKLDDAEFCRFCDMTEFTTVLRF